MESLSLSLDQLFRIRGIPNQIKATDSLTATGFIFGQDTNDDILAIDDTRVDQIEMGTESDGVVRGSNISATDGELKVVADVVEGLFGQGVVFESLGVSNRGWDGDCPVGLAVLVAAGEGWFAVGW
ncbi:unnamed protein product [Ambrosiozyma monospora]|uniref:Unnamed protein product n=1 Tax=Ambrosiozyma monospora TaxID=43982 RepID=A0A9W7DJU5_AMBMO|nr:unnamed protein product [Ambrosiozyma monospora]